jgi:hypothetical protein
VSPGWQRGRGGCKVRNTRNTWDNKGLHHC